ncbi:MAG: hypothetical protein ACREFB_14910 [Stellaceae bacterium]
MLAAHSIADPSVEILALLAYRELGGALSLADGGGDMPADARTGKIGCHRLADLRQSVFAGPSGAKRVATATRSTGNLRWKFRNPVNVG